MRLTSPDELLSTALGKLSRPLGTVVWNISCVFAWIMLPFSLMSVGSTLDVVIDGAKWLYSHFPSILPLIEPIEALVRPFVEAWRQFMAPCREWLSQVFNISISPALFDIVAGILPCAPAIMRRWLARSAYVKKYRSTAQLNSANSREELRRSYRAALGKMRHATVLLYACMAVSCLSLTLVAVNELYQMLTAR